MSDLDETFTEASDGCYVQYNTISRSIKNFYVLLDSKKETWMKCGVSTWFLMSDLDETFTEASDGCFVQYNTKTNNSVLWSDLAWHTDTDARHLAGYKPAKKK